MRRTLSVIIPNYNGSATVEICLKALFASDYTDFEVIVVDDCSEDDSVARISAFPCRLLRLPHHAGAAKARNMGAASSSGELLFFIDSDCVVSPDTLRLIDRESPRGALDLVTGGTYSRLPYDRTFFSIFQSVFINYSETKRPDAPDYIASHAMIMEAKAFKKSGGFPEQFMPILEDVEFSHRLRRSGFRLVMNPHITVRHIFHFSLYGSLANAIRKTRYWTMYSLKNKDLLVDSGTASKELKTNTAALLVIGIFGLCWSSWGGAILPSLMVAVLATNLWISRGLVQAFYQTAGFGFACRATLYYTTLYPMAVGFGAVLGMAQYLLRGGGLR